MINRDDLTRRVIDLAALDIDFDQAVSTWWYDSRDTGGLRLTDQGNEIFLECLDLDAWHYEIDAAVLIPRNLLVMDRYLTCPYHLSRSRRTYSQHNLAWACALCLGYDRVAPGRAGRGEGVA